MAKLDFNRSVAWRWVWCSIGLACCTAQAPAQYNPDWMNQIRIGPMVAFNISADFSMRGQFGISGSQPGPAGVPKADHFYDDGYVRVDQTGNAQGYTSFWGYNDPAQNAGGNQLLMHSATSFSTSQSAKESDDPYVGFELGYGASPWRWGQTRVGFEFGFGFLPIDIKDDRPAAGSFSRTTYAFDTGGIVLPTAPYNGGPSGIGPTIQDIATVVGSDNNVPGTISGSRSLDVTLLTLRLGPSFYWDLGQRFGLSVGAGGALGIVPGDLKYDEVLVLSDGSSSHNQGKVSSTQITYGGYVGATLTYHAVAHGDIYLAAQFMPMASTTFEGQGRQARLNLDGQIYISAGLNWPF